MAKEMSLSMTTFLEPFLCIPCCPCSGGIGLVVAIEMVVMVDVGVIDLKNFKVILAHLLGLP